MSLSVFVSGAMGAFFACWSFFSSGMEMYALVAQRLDGPKRLSAITNITRDGVMLAVQVVVILIGHTYEVLRPICTPEVDAIAIQAWVLVSWLITFSLIMDRVRRLMVGRFYDREATSTQYGRRSDEGDRRSERRSE